MSSHSCMREGQLKAKKRRSRQSWPCTKLSEGMWEGAGCGANRAWSNPGKAIGRISELDMMPSLSLTETCRHQGNLRPKQYSDGTGLIMNEQCPDKLPLQQLQQTLEADNHAQ